MILTLGYRGVFRQEQYETVTIEGSVTLDTDRDIPDRDLRGITEVRDHMMSQLDALVGPLIARAAQTSRYIKEETVAYEWKGLIDEASNQAPSGQSGRRVRRN